MSDHSDIGFDATHSVNLRWHKHPTYDQSGPRLDDSIKARTLLRFKCIALGLLQSSNFQDQYFESFVLTFSSSPGDNHVLRTSVLPLFKMSTMKFSSAKQNIFQCTTNSIQPFVFTLQKYLILTPLKILCHENFVKKEILLRILISWDGLVLTRSTPWLELHISFSRSSPHFKEQHPSYQVFEPSEKRSQPSKYFRLN